MMAGHSIAAVAEEPGVLAYFRTNLATEFRTVFLRCVCTGKSSDNVRLSLPIWDSILIDLVIALKWRRWR